MIPLRMTLAHSTHHHTGAARNKAQGFDSAPNLHHRVLPWRVCEESARVNRGPRIRIPGVARRHISRNGRKDIQGAETSFALD